jgi:ATP adenylyltransferase/5',5'''-P-1,P-4-tetraphosphate phosphorylase II
LQKKPLEQQTDLQNEILKQILTWLGDWQEDEEKRQDFYNMAKYVEYLSNYEIAVVIHSIYSRGTDAESDLVDYKIM